MQERLYRVKEGKIFDDTQFDLYTEYITNDTNFTQTTSAGLEIAHNPTRDVHVLRAIPGNMRAAEVFIDYTPAFPHDQGGVVLFETNENTAQLLEYQDEAAFDPLTNIKIIRNNQTFDLFMKHETFLHADSITYPFSKFGFIAKRGEYEYAPVVISRFVCTTSELLAVQNLEEGFRVELETEDELLSGVADIEGIATIRMSHLVAEGSLRVIDAAGQVITEMTASFYAGDEWSLGSFLVIKKDGYTLDTLTPKMVGRIVGHEPLTFQLELHNPTTAHAVNIQLAISKYQGLFGDEWVDIAPLTETGEADAYGDTLHIPSLAPGGSVFFWVKLERDSTITGKSAFYFYVVLSHE